MIMLVFMLVKDSVGKRILHNYIMGMSSESKSFSESIKKRIASTQKVLVDCFNLLHDAHHSRYAWGFDGPRGNLRCADFKYA